MKRMWNALLAALLIAVFCLNGYAEVGRIIPGISALDAYEEMLAAFELGEYEIASGLLDEYELVEKNIKDARLYSNYLDAMAFMQKGEYDLAAHVYEGLMSGDAPFLDSKLLYHYCTGRHAQDTGDYDQAITSYTQSAAYGDSAQRMLECIDLRDQALIAQAQECYEMAVLLEDLEMMEASALLYSQLGDSKKAATIRTEIRSIEKKKEYSSALLSYEAASMQADVKTLMELKAYFTSLGDYENSAAMAKACADQLAAISRSLTMDAPVVGQTTMKLSWHDSVADGCTYVISYAPEHVAEVQRMSTTELSVTLESLLPGTVYAVTLGVEGQPEQVLSTSAATLPADLYQEAAFASRSSRLVGVKATYLNYYSLAQLLDEKQMVLTYYDDYRLPLKPMALALQPMKYCYVISYQQKEAVAEPAEVKWILRTESAGTYAVVQPEKTALQTSGRLFVELDALLAPVYEAAGHWPTETTTVELYINDMLAAQGPMILQQE